MTKEVVAVLLGIFAARHATGVGPRIERTHGMPSPQASVTYAPQITFGATFDPFTLTWGSTQNQVVMADSGDSNKPPVADRWEFGDGSAPAISTTDQFINHTFPFGAGKYKVTLTVGGATASQKISIVPEGPPPLPPSPQGDPSSAVVVIGAGTAGNWATEIEMANPIDQPLSVVLSARGTVFVEGCPSECPDVQTTVPSNGTLLVSASAVRGVPPGLHAIYIASQDPGAAPVVRARARNALNPQLTTELPVARLGTITGLAATTLNFPSAIRTADTHVNLVIASIVPDGGGPVFAARVEAFASDGTLLGSMNVTNDSGTGYSPNVFLVDVLAQLGVTTLTDGQIKVTKLSGDGALWGGMAVVYPAGVVALSPGINP